MNGQTLLKPRGLAPARMAELKQDIAGYAAPISPEDQAAVARMREKLQRRGQVAAGRGGRRARGESDARLMQQLGIDRLEAEFKAMLDCLRRMPKVKLPAELRAHWPEVVRDVWSIYAAEEAREKQSRQVNTVRPSAAEIDRMDRAIVWLLRVSEYERKLILGRAGGMGYRAIAAKVVKMGSKDTVRKDYLAALVRLAFHNTEDSGRLS